MSETRGSWPLTKLPMSGSINAAVSTPTLPPSVASRRLSAMTCRTTRRAEQPSAIWTAISRWRPWARASSRFATLVQAMSRMNATAPSAIHSRARTSFTRLSSIGTTSTGLYRMGRNCVGCIGVNSCTRPRSSWRACSADTPGRRRPITVRP
jgi:hypothetical protein